MKRIQDLWGSTRLTALDSVYIKQFSKSYAYARVPALSQLRFFPNNAYIKLQNFHIPHQKAV